MKLEDIEKAQEELVEEAHDYFESWYEKEEEFRKELIGEDEPVNPRVPGKP